MGKYEGYATMYMIMPMSTSTLPIQGECFVDDRKVTLKFPFTGIEFELPTSPKEGRNDFDFKIRGARGDMTLTIGYVEKLRCFTGRAVADEDDKPALTFVFFPDDSPMSRLPKL
ncbi:hypothetical protein NP493_893g01078 [Ridgeia piscesae]|uniref:Uncharacterized protein n=1 Tax=Ridgeia piscesae TaxID=27915 RepID=A0AAD9NKB3_RIDPI|nr:hypothetical protein NP493_893g01078 [Ridgeia piscesae]